MSQNQKALFIIFGGTGDLAYRKLYPALYQLYSKNYLNENFAVIGTARREWSDEYYQEIVTESIEDIKSSDEEAQAFASHFRYQSHNVKDTDNYYTLRDLAEQLDERYEIDGNRVFYLSMSPNFFGTITSHLKEQNLVTKNGFNRVIIEKPFGTNYKDSNQLNNEILQTFDEEQIYRIDHYLGKHMIESLLSLRFSNPILKPLWNNDFISNIQITLAEDIGVEERGAFYEQSGALRDMVQNHVMHIISLLLMDKPAENNSESIIKEKVKALESLSLMTPEVVREKFVRGQYGVHPENQTILDYLNEKEVDPKSEVETFVAGKIESTQKNWLDVPVYIRTGKRMEDKVTRVDIVFKRSKNGIFEEKETANNILTIHIGPEEGLELQLNHKQVGHGNVLEPITLKYKEDEQIADDYEKLILNALEGNKTSFVHWEEVAVSWKYIDAIREAWALDTSDLKVYPANTNGPKEAIDLIEKDGNYWVW